MSDAKEKSFISAIVYVHNEEKTMESFLTTLNDFLRNTFLKYEIICVIDDSSDPGKEIIRNLAQREEMGVITVLNMSFFQGLELSMDAGVDLSIGDYVFEFDNTVLSYPEEMMEKVYRRCLEGFDIVSACPKRNGYGFSNAFYALYNSTSNSQNKIRTESFRILSRRAINRAQAMSKMLRYRKAVYANCGLPTDALFYDRILDARVITSKERSAQRKTAVDALILYTNTAYKFSLFFSFIMMAITIFMAIYAIILYLSAEPVIGWTTTILFLSFSFFGISVLLTILVKYAELILLTVFTKQKYVIESVQRLNN